MATYVAKPYHCNRPGFQFVVDALARPMMRLHVVFAICGDYVLLFARLPSRKVVDVISIKISQSSGRTSSVH